MPGKRRIDRAARPSWIHLSFIIASVILATISLDYCIDSEMIHFN